jgi:hypothetical protein
MIAQPVIMLLPATVWGPAKVQFQRYSHWLQSYWFWRVKCLKCETKVSEMGCRLGCGVWGGRHWRYRSRGYKKGSKIDMQMKTFDFLSSTTWLSQIKGNSEKIAIFSSLSRRIEEATVWLLAPFRSPLYDFSPELSRILYDFSSLLSRPLYDFSSLVRRQLLVCSPALRRALYDFSSTLRRPLYDCSPPCGGHCMTYRLSCGAHCMFSPSHWGGKCMIAFPCWGSTLWLLFPVEEATAWFPFHVEEATLWFLAPV